jgi:hypothetical protein
MDLLNETPFAVERQLFLAPEGREQLLVVAKGTWAIEGLKPALAPAQVSVSLADAYRGEPERSSLVEACDLVPGKPATDVLVLGCAYTTEGRRTEVLVGFKLGPLQKGLKVFGDRAWRRTLGIASATEPRPFTKMEITWERAFGGTDESVPGRLERCGENPVGVGFRGRGSAQPVADAPLPNVEDPLRPLCSPGDRPPPAGFGPVAPHWASRARHAGTYDDAWRRSRYPFLPDDFHSQFYQAAPPDQILRGHLRGGEQMIVAGMTPEGRLAFTLPRLAPRGSVRLRRGDIDLPAGNCDTVVVDCERRTITLVWRSVLDVHGKVPSLSRVRLVPGDSSGA